MGRLVVGGECIESDCIGLSLLMFSRAMAGVGVCKSSDKCASMQIIKMQFHFNQDRIAVGRKSMGRFNNTFLTGIVLVMLHVSA